MKKKNSLLILFILLIMIILLFFIIASKDDYKVIEVINLDVPENLQDQWVEAENRTWAKWLIKQKGYLGRNIFYNYNEGGNKGIIILKWKDDKSLVSANNDSEKDKYQKEFEDLAKKLTNQSTNPFTIIDPILHYNKLK